MPVTSAAEADRRRRGGQVAERRRALQQVLPLAPDARDLDEVVHHRDRREADLLGPAGDRRQPFGGLRRPAGPGEPPDLQSEAHGHGILLLAAGGGGRGEAGPPARRRPVRPRPGGRRRTPRRRRSPSTAAAIARSWLVISADGTASGRARLRARHSRSGVSTSTAWHGTPAAPARLAEPVPDVAVERRGVDDREQAPGQPLGDDELEHLEGVGAGPQVVAMASRPSPAGRPRTRSSAGEPAPGPRRLAGTRRARPARRGTDPGAGSSRRGSGPAALRTVTPLHHDRAMLLTTCCAGCDTPGPPLCRTCRFALVARFDPPAPPA